MFNGTNVKTLTSGDFEEDAVTLKSKRCTFVLYYADWCGHCQITKPEWIKFAETAQFIHVAAVDSDAQENLLAKMNKNGVIKIKGFPTIIMYCKGKPIEEFNDKRTAANLLKAAMKICTKKCKCDL